MLYVYLGLAALFIAGELALAWLFLTAPGPECIYPDCNRLGCLDRCTAADVGGERTVAPASARVTPLHGADYV